MTSDREGSRGDLRSYGRRRGRSPSARQKALWHEVLPRLAVPSDPQALGRPIDLFAPSIDRLWLEIGFGGGEHMVWQARHNPRVGLIGCEPFEDGVTKALSAVQAEGLANVRIHPGDGRPVLRSLPEASVDRLFVLFPDPWPKKRHHKRRLVSNETVAGLARVLRGEGELRIATDVGEYASAILLAVLGHSGFRWLATGAEGWRRRPSDWPQTRYEAKALRAGRKCYYLRFRRARAG